MSKTGERWPLDCWSWTAWREGAGEGSAGERALQQRRRCSGGAGEGSAGERAAGGGGGAGDRQLEAAAAL
jgi:hypothetical protein